MSDAAPPRRFALAAMALCLVGLLPGFAAVDLYVGWLDRDQGSDDSYYLEDEVLGWVPRPHYERAEFDTRLDRFGLRNPELPAERSEDEVRILGLGASRLYGANGIRQGDTWAYQLQALLEAGAPGRYRVLNGGVMAYSLVQACRRGRRLLDAEQGGVRVDPDIVLVVVSPGGQMLLGGGADRRFVRVGGELVDERLVAGWPAALRPLRVAVHRLLLHSALYVRHRARRTAATEPDGPALDNWTWTRAEDSPEVLARVDASFAELAEFHAECTRRGLDFAVLAMPESYQDSDARWRLWATARRGTGAPPASTPRLEGAELVVERCRQLGIPAWDLTDEIERLGSDLPRYYTADTLHWSPRGMAVIARALAEHLVADGLVRLEQGG